jgi:hypothetical protein
VGWRRRSGGAAAVAGCVAVVLAGGAHGHDPVREDAARAASAPAGVPTLRELAADSTVVVEGRIVRSERLDDGHVWLHRLEVVRRLRGAVDGPELSLVEHGAPSAHGPLLGDTPVVAFLRAAPDHPAVAAEPPGSRFALTGGRSGLVPVADDAERAALDRALADGAHVRTLADADAARAARRALAFRELASGVPRLAADAVLELARVDPLRDLTDGELDAVRSTLANGAIPAATRVALMDLLAARRAVEALAAILAAASESPALLDARLRARAALGAPHEHRVLP